MSWIDALNKFGEDTKLRAMRNLGAVQDRWGIRAKWKDKKPVSYKKKKYKGRFVATGKLKNSIDYTITDRGVTFTMLGYGQNIEEGRKGRVNAWGIGTNPSSKGAPVKAIQDWMRAKNVKPRNEDGKFIKATKSAKDSTGFLINRKIKWFGQAPNPFFSEALKDSLDENYKDLIQGKMDDLFNRTD